MGNEGERCLTFEVGDKVFTMKVRRVSKKSEARFRQTDMCSTDHLRSPSLVLIFPARHRPRPRLWPAPGSR